LKVFFVNDLNLCKYPVFAAAKVLTFFGLAKHFLSFFLWKQEKDCTFVCLKSNQS